jgi:hypothetical protein
MKEEKDAEATAEDEKAEEEEASAQDFHLNQ